MTDEQINNAKLLLNDDTHCVLEFNGPGSVIFMDCIFGVLLSEARHMLDCENCATARNLNKDQINDIISFTSNILRMRGYHETSTATRHNGNIH